ncbi:MAG: hypothetical protein KF814_02055 [Nitrospiraceae bacterium]|nr:hypothetical protein [Nitrospiraceae bacterium]
MAFNQVGDFWLAPGQSIRVHLALGGLVNEVEWGGQDFGAQWIMADGVGINPVRLMVTEHTKEKKPLRLHPGSPNPIVYSVTVTNIGEELAHFTLQGGGNV